MFSVYGKCEKTELDQATDIVFRFIETYLEENRAKWKRTKEENTKRAKLAAEMRWVSKKERNNAQECIAHIQVSKNEKKMLRNVKKYITCNNISLVEEEEPRDFSYMEE